MEGDEFQEQQNFDLVHSISATSLTNSSDMNTNQIISDQLEYEEDGLQNNILNNSNSPIINNNNNDNTNSNNNVNQKLNTTNNNNSNNNNNKNSKQVDTIFDIILQWGSLAMSKLCFYPIEYPIHALTTFIQSNHLPPTPMNIGLQSLVNSPPTAQHSFLASSLSSLLRQKGYHIYDGGLVYLLHNMITILINFIQRSHKNIEEQRHRHLTNSGQFIDFSLSLLKYALTLPLDVLMTRLIVHKFYKNNSSHPPDQEITLISLCKNEGVTSGLYAGWQVIVLKSLLETVYKKLDNHLRFNKMSGRYSSGSATDKSPAQILLLGVKLLLDYMLSVIKVRLNIRNIGFLKTVKNIIRREGIYGLFSGLNVYFMLFPLWMISVLVANYFYISFKNLIEKSDIPPPPPTTPIQDNSNTTFDDEIENNTLNAGMTNLSDLSLESQTPPIINSPSIQNQNDQY